MGEPTMIDSTRDQTPLPLRLDELGEGVRVDVLRRLAEQAMSDPEFRAVARVDLLDALEVFGYDLTERELELVLRFRDAVAEAGIDIFLEEGMPEQYRSLLDRLVS